MKACMQIVVLCLLGASLFGQTQIRTEANYNGWGWQAIVMQNQLITVATVPVIGARIMQYDLGDHPSLFINPAELGKTHAPNQSVWYNYGGYKVWPAPQEVWNWPPPAILDAGPYSAEIVDNTQDSVAVFVKSKKETWSKTPNISMERRAVIYRHSSRVKVEQSILNEGAKQVNWSVWSVSQCIVNHPGQKDYENFWVYFPIKTEGSVFGASGVKASAASAAWKGEMAPGVYGVQFKPEGKKIFADSPEGWIAYVDEKDGVGFFKVFDVYHGESYPDGGACNEVWINNSPAYLEVEVLSPIWPIAPGGKITFVEDWYAARINGPILTVNRCGAVETHLQYDPATGNVYGAYGVFYLGSVRLTFLDAAGSLIADDVKFTVTPMEKLTIEQKISVPQGAAIAELRLYDVDGRFVGALDRVQASRLVHVKSRVPVSPSLLRAYPNPFNAAVTLEFCLDEPQTVELIVYRGDGRRVARLFSGILGSGIHRRSWEAGDETAGIYFVRLRAGKDEKLAKILLIK
ncbi:MAG: T9SS type A sorting domain-containing protein [candidate division KSB1 bacterium]|nr:T9SS type A sorting domain-containing protein [candidate division KSB1 bacterium]